MFKHSIFKTKLFLDFEKELNAILDAPDNELNNRLLSTVSPLIANELIIVNKKQEEIM